MQIILMSVLAGMVGMGLGGIITAIWGAKTERMISIFLSFAAGIMACIVFLELIPESIEHAGYNRGEVFGMSITILGLLIGVGLVFTLNKIVDKITRKKEKLSTMHNSYTEFFHAEDILAGKRSMLKSGIIILIAIGLHNFPEGIAIGAAGTVDLSLGFTIALMIGLHCIPEGMAVAAPLISGGMSKIKAVLLIFLIGVPTVIGAALGMLIGGISDVALALAFSVAGGAMLYVVFGEIIPQAIATNKDRVPAGFVLAGIIVGMLMTLV
ncbi:MAG: ZIP family metal transporter [Defluviitaleaceae bacterium]|nr:ZIP family metal transporter [Defluviitaleaceae bacterium]